MVMPGCKALKMSAWPFAAEFHKIKSLVPSVECSHFPIGAGVANTRPPHGATTHVSHMTGHDFRTDSCTTGSSHFPAYSAVQEAGSPLPLHNATVFVVVVVGVASGVSHAADALVEVVLNPHFFVIHRFTMEMRAPEQISNVILRCPEPHFKSVP